MSKALEGLLTPPHRCSCRPKLRPSQQQGLLTQLGREALVCEQRHGFSILGMQSSLQQPSPQMHHVQLEAGLRQFAVHKALVQLRLVHPPGVKWRPPACRDVKVP